MKKQLLPLAAGLLVCAGQAFAQEAVSRTFDAVADTWIRENNTGWKDGGAKTTIETQRVAVKNEAGDVTGYAHFAGLIGFDYEVPSGMKVQKAVLHLVTERSKGGDIYVRAYDHNFAEKTSWGDEEAYLTAAFATEPIAVFTPAGQWNKAIFDALDENKQNLDSWINDIDVTSYVKTVPASAGRVDFLLTQEGDKALNQVCFFTKDNNGTDDAVKSEALKNLPASDLMPELVVTFVEDSNTATEVFAPSADTWIRKGNTTKRGSAQNMEIYYTTAEDGSRDKEFYGLMSFSGLPIELNSDEYELQNAVLRLTCVYLKGDRNIEIYDYPAEFAESDALFSTEEENVKTALASDPVKVFETKGQGNKSVTDTGINEDYRNAAAWTNEIDLTDYLAARKDRTNFNILLSKQKAQADAVKFATKEAEDITNADPGFTFAATDIRPQLTVTYTKKENGNTSIVDSFIGNDNEAEAEYYNLQGVRVMNPGHGLYIVRKGNKVSKVIL